MPEIDKIKITQKEFEELYQLEEIPKEDEIQNDQSRKIETDTMTYEETVTYGDEKLIKEFKEEHE